MASYSLGRDVVRESRAG